MKNIDPAYTNTWRASPTFLWLLALIIWVAGASLELWLPGSFAASGGLAIAFTTPLFASAFSKQATYELDLKLARINLTRENNRSAAVYPIMSSATKARVADEMAETDTRIEGFQTGYEAHRIFSAKLLVAQAWIVGLSSSIAAVGSWVANLIHCGRATC